MGFSEFLCLTSERRRCQQKQRETQQLHRKECHHNQQQQHQQQHKLPCLPSNGRTTTATATATTITSRTEECLTTTTTPKSMRRTCSTVDCRKSFLSGVTKTATRREGGGSILSTWLLATFLLTVICIESTTTATIVATTRRSEASTSIALDGANASEIGTETTTTATTATKLANVTRTFKPPLEFIIEEAVLNGEHVPDVGYEEEDNNNNKNNNNQDNSVPSSNEQQLQQFYKLAKQQLQQQQQQQIQQHNRHRQRDTQMIHESFNDDDDDGVFRRSAEINSAALKASSTEKPATTTTTTTETAAKCEPKVLEDVPPEPFYDFSDITDEAASQFSEFVSSKFGDSSPPLVQSISDHLKEELRRRANTIAGYALSEDESLLAFALAAPSVDTVVVKFRDNVTIPPDQQHNKSSFLSSYWRELGMAWNSSDGSQEWGAPFRDCNPLKGRWLWPFRLSSTESKIKIVAVAFIAADEDLCNDGLEEIFGRKHGCDRNTTFCLLTEVKPAASRDSYTCICRESYYLPNSKLQGFPGDVVEFSEDFGNYSCIPCPGGCSTCDQHGACLFGEPQELVSMENLLRVSVGSVLGACILCCVVLGVIVFRQRKCKAIATGMWTVLETILLGIVLLYASVAVHFFPASTERCLLEPWLRELGFITCYGAIILKLYRHLVDFRTRKAHRWVLRDVDLLKYLGTMVFAVICYMAAFTASSLDLIETAQLEGLRELRTNTCHPLKWELVTQASEMLILCFGLHLAFACRNANTQFRERQFLVASLVLEFSVSSSYYVLRLIYLPELSPGAILLALFLRAQLTNTISLGLIFVPKLWYQHKQGSHDVGGHHLGGGYAGLCLGDPDIGELTIAEMSPDDIRAELKRLYTQLEILKNKTLRQDNPHISKRRGGRKAGHRRFSLQKKGSKDKALSAKHRSNKHHQDLEITEAEPSRTPEDSVCSVEGPTDTYAEITRISHAMLSHPTASASHSK